MIQLGAVLSGISLFALFTWLPIWQLGSAGSAELVFEYFVLVAMLFFGVFMTSGGKASFSFIRFTPSFVAGVMISMGWSDATWWLVAAGVVLFGFFWLFFKD